MHHDHTTIEILEARIAPAAVFHYTDVDGDKVTLTSSLGVNADLASAAHVVVGQLQLLDIETAMFGAEFSGASFSFTVVKALHGDGLANVGYINATGVDLGTVSVLGDLGRIDAGNATTSTPAILALTAKSLGRFGTDTQAAGGNLTSNIKGPLGALTVAGDVTGVFISVTGGADGKIGPITIGGSLVGGSTLNAGEILASGDIGAVKITGSVLGGSASFTGFIQSFTGKIASVAIGGSVVGGAGADSGTIGADGDMGAVTVGGSVLGGAGTVSGDIQSSNGKIASVTINGSLIGGQATGAVGSFSGVIDSAGDIAFVKIGGNVQGGTAATDSGEIQSDNGKLLSVSIGGSLLGGSGSNSGLIIAHGDLGAVTIGHDVIGGTGTDSAFIASSTGKIASLTIAGSLIGGTKMGSGEVTCAGDIGAVKIGQNVQGGSGLQSGFIRTTSGKIASLAIGGSLTGGSVGDSGEVISHGDFGAITIGHDLQGGGGAQSGRIQSEVGKIASVSIGGSLLGGSASNAGEILSHGDLGSVKITHDLTGGSMSNAGRIGVEVGKLGGISIGGSLIGGAGADSAEVTANGDVGVVSIAHDFRGGSGPDSGFVRSAAGAIASVTIGGSIVGGSGNGSGLIQTALDLGPVKIGRDLQGGSGAVSGFVSSGGKLASISVGGSIVGASNSGANLNSGEIFAQSDIGPVFIGHDLRGGGGAESGSIKALSGKIAGVKIGGSVVGGSAGSSGFIQGHGDVGVVTIGRDVQGGSGQDTGAIESATGKLAGVTLAGSLRGGSGQDSGTIVSAGDLGPIKIGRDFTGGSVTGSATLDESGYIASTGGRIVSVAIGGSIISGIDGSTANQAGGDLTRNASIRAANDLGSLTVTGSIAGNRGANGDSPVVISARGQLLPGLTTDVAMGKISVLGRVESARILAGYKTDLTPANADAQTGAITVGRDWIASSFVAGAKNSGSPKFGDANDVTIGGGSAAIVARIASISIGGQVVGTPSPATTDHFGFVAQQIGSFKAGLFIATLTAAKDAPIPLSLPTADVTLHEI